MNKKLVLAVVLAGIAGYQAQAVAPHTGFSIGANLGVTNVSGKLNRNFTTPANDGSDFGARSPVFGLFLGYGWSPNPHGVYVGAEIFGQIQNVKAKREDLLQVLNWTTQLQTNNTFGAVAKLGYVCKEALFFLKAGVASTKWKFNFNAAQPGVPAVSLSQSPRKTGFLVGLGMDYAIARNWAVGAEYLYGIYGSLKLAGAAENFTYKPKVGTFNLRLKYTF